MKTTIVEMGAGRSGGPAAPAVMFDWDVWQIRDINALAIRFRLHQPARVTIRLAPLNGESSKVLYDAPRNAGEFSEGWRFVGSAGQPAAPGVYLVALDLDGESAAETLLIKG